MKDLAPNIYRQRLVIEGIPNRVVTAEDIKEYLSKLSDVLKMKILLAPVTHRSDKYGEAGWIHWESSGAHFYAWEQPTPLFSVDIYTCKKFEDQKAVDFTKEFFGASEIAYKNF
jgi:S-adenosylmethionine/arginine decarboxylase-like enzyme